MSGRHGWPINLTPTPVSTCGWCGRSSRSRVDHRQCAVIASLPKPEPEHALTGGEWRYNRRRGVQVWVEDVDVA